MNEPMEHAYVVIMAGGSGTRFWPLSRRERPKQLLPLAPDGSTLIAATMRRARQLVPPERTLVVTSRALRDATVAALPELPPGNVLAEPTGRNTAPCVGWAASHVRRRDPQGRLAILPADHHVGDEDAFVQVVRASLAAAADGALVTVGLRPSRPETGYGYIELGEAVGEGVYQARRFVEKPNRTRAEQFFSSGRFLWNSGMFFFRADAILQAVDEHLPGLGEALGRFDEAAAEGAEQALVDEEYGSLPAVSIDHGIMEKVEGVLVVPGDFGWSDLGSWTTAWELADRDADDNAVPDGTIALDSSGNYVRVPAGKLVALIGVDDLVVVDTGDALLVVPRDRAQDVRHVVETLREREDDRH
ncbi:MAG: mannose-1-phosphate guanylyltransferase [Myxococcota bacterium]